MERLLSFCSLGASPFFPCADQAILKEMAALYSQMVEKQLFSDRKEQYNSWDRVGKLGQPKVCTAWDRFFPDSVVDTPVSFTKKSLFQGGYEWELNAYYYLRRLGYEVLVDHSIELMDGLIKGHPDFICVDPKTQERFVVETKNVQDSTFKEFKKKGMTNDVYLHQLSIYCYGMKMNGCWFIRNSVTGEMMAIPLTSDYLPVDKVMQTMAFVALLRNKVTSFGEVLQYITPPKPIARKDGTYYVPPSMYRNGELHPACCLYEYHFNDEGKTIVTGYNYPIEAKQWEPPTL